MIYILHDRKDLILNYGNYGIFLIMGSGVKDDKNPEKGLGFIYHIGIHGSSMRV